MTIIAGFLTRNFFVLFTILLQNLYALVHIIFLSHSSTIFFTSSTAFWLSDFSSSDCSPRAAADLLIPLNIFAIFSSLRPPSSIISLLRSNLTSSVVSTMRHIKSTKSVSSNLDPGACRDTFVVLIVLLVFETLVVHYEIIQVSQQMFARFSQSQFVPAQAQRRRRDLVLQFQNILGQRCVDEVDTVVVVITLQESKEVERIDGHNEIFSSGKSKEEWASRKVVKQVKKMVQKAVQISPKDD
nr:hypothetical protein Iba_chr13cCG3120 [Ipomoea batatas]